MLLLVSGSTGKPDAHRVTERLIDFAFDGDRHKFAAGFRENEKVCLRCPQSARKSDFVLREPEQNLDSVEEREWRIVKDRADAWRETVGLIPAVGKRLR